MSEKIRQEKRTLVDPTPFGQTFMPPWSVTCPDCETIMVSYGNNPTTKCTSCGKHVRPDDHSVKRNLPDHSVIDTDLKLTALPKTKQKK
jgi:ribosomal protein S27E